MSDPNSRPEYQLTLTLSRSDGEKITITLGLPDLAIQAKLIQKAADAYPLTQSPKGKAYQLAAIGATLSDVADWGLGKLDTPLAKGLLGDKTP